MLQRRRTVAVVTVAGFGLVLVIPVVTGDGAWFGLATFPGMAMLIVATRRLERQFGVPLVFVRDNANWWSGAAGGLLGAVGAWTGAWLVANVPLSRVPAILLLLFVYTFLLFVLLYGAVLQDVADGYVTVDQST
jgi:hypothetical protein